MQFIVLSISSVWLNSILFAAYSSFEKMDLYSEKSVVGVNLPCMYGVSWTGVMYPILDPFLSIKIYLVVSMGILLCSLMR